MSLFYKVNQTKFLQSYACPNNEPSKIWAQQGPWRGKVIIKHNIGLVNLGYRYFPLDFIKILPCGLLCGKVPVFWSKLKYFCFHFLGSTVEAERKKKKPKVASKSDAQSPRHSSNGATYQKLHKDTQKKKRSALLSSSEDSDQHQSSSPRH